MPFRSVRRVLAATTVACTVVLVAPAADPPAEKTAVKTAPLPKWETVRATSPETAAEMKALQARVKEVAAKAIAATVCIVLEPSVGSGVIVSDDGLILTAGHVIDKPRSKLKFVLADGTLVSGVALGVNERADSGMAKITDPVPKDAKWPGAKEGKWPKVELGKSEGLAAGQWLVALGHPNGLKPERPPVVRVGRHLRTEEHRGKEQLNELMRKARNRNRPREENDTPGKFVQTNCTIVGGDSGGPLFDLDGKLVGIHSQIGMLTLDQNYHVPVDKFHAEWARLKRGDDIGWQPTVAMNLVFEDENKNGLTVSEVREGGAAERAGIEVGDVFKTLAGHSVKTREDVAQILSAYATDDKVKIELTRDGESMTVELKLTRKTNR